MRTVLRHILLAVLGLGVTWSAASGAGDPTEALRAIAEREHDEPGRPFELGLPGAPIPDLIPTTNSAAHTPLDTVRESYLGTLPDPVPAPGRVTREARREALRLYVRARSSLNAGELEAGLATLEEAAALDSESGELLSELGLVRVSAGQAQSAMRVLDRAVELGQRDASTLYSLARLRLDQGETEAALALLFEAEHAIRAGSDPALEPLTSAALGVALLERGHTLAGAQSLERSLAHPARLSATTRYVSEFGTWVRQRQSLAQRGASAFQRVGRVDAAARLYGLEDGSRSLNPDDLLTRLVSAHAAAGRPAEAALSVLRTFSDLTAPPSDRQIRLLAIVAERSPHADEIGEALRRLREEASTSPPSIRSGLALAHARVLDENARMGVLRAACAEPWASEDLLRAWLAGETRESAVARHAGPILERSPHHAETLARLLMQTRQDPPTLLEELTERDEMGARLLLGELSLLTDRPDLATPDAPADTSTPAGRALAVVHAALLAETGQWERYGAALGTITTERGFDRVQIARALAAGQRFRDALDALSDAGPTVASLRLSADIRRTLGEPGPEAACYEEALRLDPTDETLHHDLLQVLTTNAQMEDRVGPALRRLRDRLPAGRLLQQLLAQNLIQSGVLDQAERRLDALVEDGAPLNELVPIYATCWSARITRDNNAGSIPEAIERLRAFHERHPASLDVGAVLAGLLAASEQRDEGLGVLESVLNARLEASDASRALEQYLRTTMDDPAAANQRALQRLERGTLGVDETLELAQIRLSIGVSSLPDVLSRLAAGLPAEVTLTREQSSRLAGVADAASNLASVAGTDESADSAAALADLAISRGAELAPLQHERRLKLLARSASQERIVRACRTAARQHPNLGTAVWLVAAQALNQAQRGDTALGVLSVGLGELGEPLNTQVLQGLIQTAGTRATPEGVRAMARSLHESGIDAEAAEAATAMFSLPTGSVVPGAPPARARAELIYLTSLYADSSGREAVASELLELAIETDPTHPWAANDLGYKLAEEGVELARAETLLVAAAEALPDRGSVLDSLGWLRYKTGQLENDGEIEGAVSLLRRATQQDDGQDNPTIFLHLGDALYRVGLLPEAREAWAKAASLAQIQQRNAIRNGGNARLTAELSREIREALSRINSLDRGSVPTLAPIPALDDPPPEAGDDPSSDP
ncbi:MAG: hypothetical protein ACF8Q5_15020 [Phycisphaerales bacterium JB040]